MKKKILLSIVFSVFVIALIGIVAKLYLNSKDNALTIKQDFKIARVILIFFIIIGLILAFSSYKQKQEI